MTDIMKLSEAGYREKVFTKSWLAECNAGATPFAEQMRWFHYDPHRDEIITPSGNRRRVSREGTASKAILAKHGLDDSDCLTPEE